MIGWEDVGKIKKVYFKIKLNEKKKKYIKYFYCYFFLKDKIGGGILKNSVEVRCNYVFRGVELGKYMFLRNRI